MYLKQEQLTITLNDQLFDSIERYCKEENIEPEIKSLVQLLTGVIYEYQIKYPDETFAIRKNNLNILFSDKNLYAVFLSSNKSTMNSFVIDDSKSEINGELFFFCIKDELFNANTKTFNINYINGTIEKISKIKDILIAI
ncbi:MAG: hypothetical protein ACOYO1_07320 [Bacteroidales bacterium]